MMARALSRAFAGVLLVGCAAGDPGTDIDGSSRAARTPAVRGATPPQQGDGDGNSPGTSQSAGFGNSSAAPTALPPVEQRQDGCVVGERCRPTQPDPDDCGSLTLEAEVEVIEHPGNVLLVFDRSSSMSQDWNGQARWEEAGAAIENALTPLSDLLTVGSVFFPSSDPDAEPTCVDPTGIACIFVPFLVAAPGTCGVNAITESDQIDFKPGADFLGNFAGATNTAPPYAPIPGGFTPLKEGLLVAQAALSAAELEGLTSVIIITDGEPNCEWDVAVARQIVADWHASGINTHVIGLPGVGGDGPTILDQLAAAGGTDSFITPADATALEERLRQIATETVQAGFESCEITINPPAEAPDKLHLVVTEGGADQSVARELSEDAGWNVTSDGSLVTLEGRLCDDATDGRFQAMRFEFGCVDLPPLPPPEVPQ